MTTEQDRTFMRLALAEAGKGCGRTAPNPCVGAVIVKDGRVVGRGYHKKAGTPHAEIHALAVAGEEARGATMYVTLEPCNHTGRTPPCSHAVAGAGIARVVIGLRDPNPKASGGIQYLESQGIKVVTGVCEDECRQINLPFLKRIATGLPWVVMKAATSLDGRITYQKGRAGTITGTRSREKVHRLRNRLDAILIGAQTLAIDNPSLTTRLAGGEDGRDPLRIVLDTQLRADPASRIFHQDSLAETWIFCGEAASRARQAVLEKNGARVFRVVKTRQGHIDLHAMLTVLAQKNILSLLVEGGATVLGSFLAARLVDEVYLFIAPFFIGEQGEPLLKGYSILNRKDAHRLVHVTAEQAGDDCLIHGYFQDPARLCPTPCENGPGLKSESSG